MDQSEPGRSNEKDAATLDVAQEQRLLTVLEIAAVLATEHELDIILSEFMSCLSRVLDAAEYGVLLLYDSGSRRLRVRATWGYDLEPLSRIALLPGEGVAGKTFEAAECHLYPSFESVMEARYDLSPDNRAAWELATADLPQAQSCVCIPLISGDVAVGALMLENLRRPNRFAQADLPFWQAVAGLIALSVDNDRLKRELHATEALREANRLKTELISTLSHEMRTPLTSIKGYSTALLMEEASFNPDTQREFLQIIDEECDILATLIQDMLESSIIDSGLLKLERQPVLLARLADSEVSDMARRTHRHRFMIDFPADFPIVEADPDRVAQVLRNLLDNAIKYSPNGGLIVIRGEVLEDKVRISVADQGVGLAPEDVSRLFEKGFRVRSGLIRHIAGSGLGLPICQTIVESHGGRIWAESKLGQGTTLFFTLGLTGAALVLGKGGLDE